MKGAPTAGPARDGEELILPRPPSSSGPWTALWGAVLALRRRRAAATARRLPVPVVSVGNLTVGGSGKTPLVAAIAAHLAARGRRVAILSRGYGRVTRGVRVASRGMGPEGSPAEIGDEPHLLAEMLPGVALVVGEHRYAAGLHALAEIEPPPDLFLLDDGFSHVALARDLDLLAFPVERPWGNGRLLPFGTLREPLSAARAAQAVILTGLDRPLDGAAVALERALAPFGFAGSAFAAGVAARLVPPLAGSRRVVLATGIAHPERARRTARALGLDVAEHLVFPDHHSFPPASLERIERSRQSTGAAAIVVTAKDRAKVEGRTTAPLHQLAIDAVLEPAFWEFLDHELARR